MEGIIKLICIKGYIVHREKPLWEIPVWVAAYKANPATRKSLGKRLQYVSAF